MTKDDERPPMVTVTVWDRHGVVVSFQRLPISAVRALIKSTDPGDTVQIDMGEWHGAGEAAGLPA